MPQFDEEVRAAVEEAAQALAPEFGLAQVDAAGLAASFTKAVFGALNNPLQSGIVAARFGVGVAAATAVAAARALGAEADGPVAPDPRDKRFADAAWESNAWFFWRRQRYLLWSKMLTELVESSGLEGNERDKAAFGAQMLIDAMAPTNFPWSNPTAIKRAFDTGGLSLARGLANFFDDLANNGGRPRQVDASGFTVGQNLACTPGKVVFRNNMMELIQYEPQTETVHEIPLLCSPPWINKYYIMDLAPGRSFVEWAVQHGHTVFAISYRNPDESMSDVSMDDYLIHGPRTALDVIQDITGAPQVNVVALCLGGTLAVGLAAYLKATGDDRLRSMALLNTLVDFSEPGPLGVFCDAQTVERLEEQMAKTGYLDADHMRTTFDVLRANDLIWNYVASNWLMGEEPPAFDILAWNADATRMPAKMHSFYLRSCYLENLLAQGQMELASERLHLDAIDASVLIVSAENDHIAPWTTAYKTTQLLPKADVDFVLSSSGHIAGIVNPPSPKARYWSNATLDPDPEVWRSGAAEHQRSWWEHWVEWAAERSGKLGPPPAMGSKAHPALSDAPGAYVLE